MSKINMITKKEKRALQIIFPGYKMSGDIAIKTEDLIQKSQNHLSSPDLAKMLSYNKSEYIAWYDGACSMVKITPAGIAYMEDKIGRILREWAFWIFGVFSLLAAIYSIFSYYK